MCVGARESLVLMRTVAPSEVSCRKKSVMCFVRMFECFTALRWIYERHNTYTTIYCLPGEKNIVSKVAGEDTEIDKERQRK